MNSVLASEKLERLEWAATTGHEEWETFCTQHGMPPAAFLVRALPELIAVVKAAELKPTHVYVGIPREDGTPSGRVRYPLVDTLTALNRKLERQQ